MEVPEPRQQHRDERQGTIVRTLESATSMIAAVVPIAPIFVDESGRRRRWVTQAGYILAGGCAAYVCVAGVSLAGGVASPLLGLPIGDQAVPGQAPPTGDDNQPAAHNPVAVLTPPAGRVLSVKIPPILPVTTAPAATPRVVVTTSPKPPAATTTAAPTTQPTRTTPVTTTTQAPPDTPTTPPTTTTAPTGTGTAAPGSTN